MKDSRNPTPITRKRTDETPEQIQDQIRQKAYELFEARGSGDGHDLDDWLLAEAEVTQKAKSVAA